MNNQNEPKANATTEDQGQVICYRLKTPAFMREAASGARKDEKSGVAEAYQAVESGVVGAYKGIENAAVGAYKAIETTVVDAYKAVEGKFVETFLEPVKKQD